MIKKEIKQKLINFQKEIIKERKRSEKNEKWNELDKERLTRAYDFIAGPDKHLPDEIINKIFQTRIFYINKINKELLEYFESLQEDNKN